jgi:hypothetical protein
MSCLKLYAPDDSHTSTVHEQGFSEPNNFQRSESGLGRSEGRSEPGIVSWKSFSHPLKKSRMEMLARSRALYLNKRCRNCGRPTVRPLEQDDAVLGKNQSPIPGSATLIGFSCEYCRNEWLLESSDPKPAA